MMNLDFCCFDPEENRRGAGISSVLDGTRQKSLSGIPILTYSTFFKCSEVSLYVVPLTACLLSSP